VVAIVKLRLNTDNGANERIKQANQKRQQAKQTETIEEAWERIFAMKNSEADRQRLTEVKKAMDAGLLGREPESVGKRFSKAEALRLHKVLVERQREETLRRMVEETPENYCGRYGNNGT
jgi:DNA polymerase I